MPPRQTRFQRMRAQRGVAGDFDAFGDVFGPDDPVFSRPGSIAGVDDVDDVGADDDDDVAGDDFDDDNVAGDDDDELGAEAEVDEAEKTEILNRVRSLAESLDTSITTPTKGKLRRLLADALLATDVKTVQAKLTEFAQLAQSEIDDAESAQIRTRLRELLDAIDRARAPKVAAAATGGNTWLWVAGLGLAAFALRKA